MFASFRAGAAVALCLSVCLLVGVCGQQVFSPAERLWVRGQEAMQHKQTDRAIGFYEKSLQLDPTLTRNHLSLAAAYLEKGDDRHACLHMGRYVRSHPKHAIMRTHFAELLLRLGRDTDAAREFAQFIAQTQDQEKRFLDDQVYCYRRLMEIAEKHDDRYGELLNRGIALFLLAKKHARLKATNDSLSTQSLLFKCAGELMAAQSCDRSQARPCWYLYLVWSRLGQKHMARYFLKQTAKLATFGELTEAERRDFSLIQHELKAAVHDIRFLE